MSVDRSRITLLAGLAALAIGGALPSPARANESLAATVYRNPT